MQKKTINSLQNEQVKQLLKLNKKRNSEREGKILVEGRKEIEMALGGGLAILAHYHLDSESGLCAADFSITPEIAKKISNRESPGKNFALFERPALSLDKIKAGKNSLVLVLEDMEKPGNIGAILRTADACGADAVLLADPRTDIFNHNVIRTSRGTVFTVPLAAAGNQEIRDWLVKNRFTMAGTSPQGDIDYYDYDFRQNTALLIGTEHEGLSDFWMKSAPVKLSIPMTGKIDSLNASVSAAIICFESVRQKRKNIV